MYSRSFTYSRDGFEITSYGGGAAYAVKAGSRSFYMQGEDAVQLSDEMEAIDAQDAPRYTVADLLSDYMEALAAENPA
jgi:hypothetical protein